MLISSARTIYTRLARQVYTLYVDLPLKAHLALGDPVFKSSDRGLERIGEVVAVVRGRAKLAIHPKPFSTLKSTVRAVCWRTPLSAEATIKALLPPAVRGRAASHIASDWRAQEAELSRVWQPFVTDFATAYVEVLIEELLRTWRKNETRIHDLARTHIELLAAQWPAVQQLLQPILQEHLTPVLGEMITHAITEAPKVEIAMLVARGKHGEAYGRMLDWLAGYLAAIPEADQARLNGAVRMSWEAARNNPELVAAVERIGRTIFEDRQVHMLLADLYKDAVADNPRTAEFVRSKVVEDSRIRAHAYAFLEAFAPTARTVLALCLFDEHGATRPEIVHLVRSIALNRRVAWITLEDGTLDVSPLCIGAVLKALPGDGPR